MHTSTFSEDDLSSTVAIKVLEILTNSDLTAAMDVGVYLLEGLKTKRHCLLDLYMNVHAGVWFTL